MSTVISKEDREILISEVQIRPAIWNDADPNHKNIDFVDKKWREIAGILNKDVPVLKSKWKNLRAKMRKELLKMPKTRSGGPASGWKSSWEYFHLMYFIKDIIVAAPTSGNLPPFHNEEIRPGELTNSSDSEQIQSPQSEHHDLQATSPLYSVRSSSSQSQGPALSLHVATPQCSNPSSSSQPQVLPSKRKYKQNDERLELERKKIQILEDTSKLDKQMLQNMNNADYNFLMSLMPFIEPLNLSEKLDLRQKLQNEVNEAYKNHLKRTESSTNSVCTGTSLRRSPEPTSEHSITSHYGNNQHNAQPLTPIYQFPHNYLVLQPVWQSPAEHEPGYINAQNFGNQPPH